MKTKWMARFWFWSWPAAVIAAVAMHFWFPESSTGAGHDSYGASAQGQKAFYRLIQQHPSNYSVERNRRPLTLMLPSLPTEDVLCILGPERPPTAEEWIALVDWVRNGGKLLYAFRGDKTQEVPWLKVKYEAFEPSSDRLDPQTTLLPTQEVAWWTDGKLDAPGALPLVHYDGTVQAVRTNYGAGRVVFVATSYPYANQVLTYGDNSVLAMRLLESTGLPEFVTVDESLNSSGTSKVVGILFDPLLRPVTIQILVITLLFGWWQTKRFGPQTPMTVLPRQNIVEHTDMVGSLYWRMQQGQAALRAYLKQLSSQLKLRAFRGNEERVLELIARRSGRETAQIRKELQQAFQAVRTKHLDRRTAAKLIRRLAILRRDATTPRKPGEQKPVSQH